MSTFNYESIGMKCPQKFLIRTLTQILKSRTNKEKFVSEKMLEHLKKFSFTASNLLKLDISYRIVFR